MAMSAEWNKLPVGLTELCINTTLRCGQSFRWRKSATNEWSCSLHGRVLTLKQDATHLHYRATFPSPTFPNGTPTRQKNEPLTPPCSAPASSTAAVEGAGHDTLKLLTHYLNLTPNLAALYAQWSTRDANFRRKVLGDMANLQGIRILKQDPWEALCGFICSSNNNIKRISLMMGRLCTHYGRFIAELEEEVEVLDDGDDDDARDSDTEEMPPSPAASLRGRDSKAGIKGRMKKIKVPYHDFPPPEALTGPDVEATLRTLGFGYRAKYIYQTACMLVHDKGGIAWLEGLMNPETVTERSAETPTVLAPGGREGYRAAHTALLELTGVGPKVADCVCLMGLGWGESVPVDTHVWQIAVRDYKFRGGKGGMTRALYEAVGDKFRALWGEEAGWAHSVLFTADLRDFSRRVKVEIGTTVEDGAEIVVKKEEVEMEAVEKVDAGKGRRRAATKQRVVVQHVVKRKLGETGHEDMMSRVKRRRRTAP